MVDRFASSPAAGPVPPLREMGGPRLAVLDTNVVLDWLWFADPRVLALEARVREGSLRWHATAPMRDELVAVLGRGSLPPRTCSADEVLASYDRWCTLHPGPLHTAGADGLHCTDADDQMFIDLALALARAGADTALLTRDRAVLRLARRARLHRLWIGPPERWCDPAGPSPG